MNWLHDNRCLMGAVEWLTHNIFPVLVFIISSSLSFEDIARQLKKKALLVRAFLAACVVIPLLTALVVKILNVPMLVGGILLVSSVTPGDPFDLLEAKGKKGSIPLAAVLMTLFVVVMPLTVPFWLWVFDGWFKLDLAVAPLSVFGEIAPLTVVPFLAGILLNRFLPKAAAALRPMLEWFFKAALILLVVVFIVPAMRTLLKFDFNSVAAIFAVITLSLLIGYYAGGSQRQDRISLATASAIGNLAAVMLIAHLCYPKVHVWYPLLALVILRFFVFKFWFILLRFRIAR
ncbi:MAG: hypothetical protein WCG06_00015 [Candidatus Omnitrophota bacterium]